MGREPQGCIEKDKPVLEQSCTPRPDGDKEDKKDGAGAVVPPVIPGKWKFSGVSPGNWDVSYNEQGIVLTRKPAKNKFPCGGSSVTAKLHAEFPSPAGGDDPKSANDCLASAEKSFKARSDSEDFCRIVKNEPVGEERHVELPNDTALS